jgi:hypothetical protein
MKYLNDSKIQISPPLLSDFWSRQANTQTASFEFTPFGIPACITANQPEILAAARLSAGRYSWHATSPVPDPDPPAPIFLHLVVGSKVGAPVPADLPERLTYNGVGDWISLSAGQWGHAFANLQTRTGVAFVSLALAAEIRLVSRYIIDHYLLNFILTEWAMLHASCVLDPDGRRLILMVGPHNSGKSTTALHLLRAGYDFLADGMALIRPQGAQFIVGGYPIGEVKLRDDVLALFSNYGGEAVQVREQRKTVVNLREVHPTRLVESLFTPATIQLCLVERNNAGQTEITPLPAAEAESVLTANSVYWDEPVRLAHNTAALQALLQTANLYRLRIGTEPAEIIRAIDHLGNE